MDLRNEKKMEKSLKDYLHLYLGCEIAQVGGHPIKNNAYYLQRHSCETDKLLLRPLSDMTEEERKEIYKLIFGKEFSSGHIHFYPDRTTLQEPRYVLSRGVDRLGIQMNGQVWADCDLQQWKFNQHEVTRYLLSKSFDLFGLIEFGLAIDKTKVLTP